MPPEKPGMTMVKIGKIARGVKKTLNYNMGLRDSETLLVITDTPTDQEWRSLAPERLEEMTSRNLLARTIADIARDQFPASTVIFQTYPSVGRHSAEPGKDVEKMMKESDAVLALTTYSISHTDARENATNAKVRIASMPRILEEMFYPTGSLMSNYEKISSETLKLVEILTVVSKIRIKTETGTDLSLSLEGRRGIADTGVLNAPGSWGNLPAGEAYIAPLEGTASGVLVVERGWHPNLKERMRLFFEKGQLNRIVGGGKIGKDLTELLRPNEDSEPYLLRRNLAEFGIGTNPKAKKRDNILEAEKIRGTVHIAVGDNSHMGGRVKADYHQDFLIPSPTVDADSRRLIENGKLRISSGS
jgi:leucyl aminopeptidase (aminopeptidase T)